VGVCEVFEVFEVCKVAKLPGILLNDIIILSWEGGMFTMVVQEVIDRALVLDQVG
jgi:hypothetical protein